MKTLDNGLEKARITTHRASNCYLTWFETVTTFGHAVLLLLRVARAYPCQRPSEYWFEVSDLGCRMGYKHIRDVSWGITHNSFSVSLVKNKSHKSTTQGFKCWLISVFFSKSVQEIGKAWRKSLTCAKRASLTRFQPRCRPFVWLLPRTWIRWKIRTVLQSRLILANESWNGNCGYHFQLNAKSFNKRVKFWGNFAVSQMT